MNTIGLQSIVFIMEVTMFQTASHALDPLMSAIAGEGQHVWSYVNLAANRPWFYACYNLHTSEGAIRETIMLSTVGQVIDLLKHDKQILKVKLLMLVSPPSLNRSISWLMEPLSKIWEARITETERYAVLYDLANGKQYIDSFEDLKPFQLCDLRCQVRFVRR